MSFHLVTRRDAPQPPYECELIEVDTPAIPFMLGALYSRSQSFWWISQEDQKYGRWLMNKEMGNLLMGCVREITNRQDALYNLLDASIRGTLRDVSGEGTDALPFIYDPEIPQTVDPVIYLLPGLQHSARSTLEGVRNLANGETFTDFPDIRNFRQQLEDLITASGGTVDEETLEVLEQILAAVGGGI